MTTEISTGEPLTTNNGIYEIDPATPGCAQRIISIQQAAYAIEADLMGFDDIPPLHEAVEDVSSQTDLSWLGSFVDLRLVAITAWAMASPSEIDIDRLAVHPRWARQGHGRALVQSVPSFATATVSTGEQNAPAIALYEAEGFANVGRTEVAPGIFTSQFRRSP